MSGRDAQAGYGTHIARRSSFGFADFVADDAPDGRTTNGPERAALRQNGASDGPGASADGSALSCADMPEQPPRPEQQLLRQLH